MSKHLKLLQWCIDNSSEVFSVDYRYTLGQSWLSGDAILHCIHEDDVDSTISWLEVAKGEYSPKELAKKRKTELLAELEKLNATLSG